MEISISIGLNFPFFLFSFLVLDSILIWLVYALSQSLSHSVSLSIFLCVYLFCALAKLFLILPYNCMYIRTYVCMRAGVRVSSLLILFCAKLTFMSCIFYVGIIWLISFFFLLVSQNLIQFKTNRNCLKIVGDQIYFNFFFGKLCISLHTNIYFKQNYSQISS